MFAYKQAVAFEFSNSSDSSQLELCPLSTCCRKQVWHLEVNKVWGLSHFTKISCRNKRRCGIYTHLLFDSCRVSRLFNACVTYSAPRLSLTFNGAASLKEAFASRRTSWLQSQSLHLLCVLISCRRGSAILKTSGSLTPLKKNRPECSTHPSRPSMSCKKFHSNK